MFEYELSSADCTASLNLGKSNREHPKGATMRARESTDPFAHKQSKRTSENKAI